MTSVTAAQMVVMRWPVADCLHPLSALELVRRGRSSCLLACHERETGLLLGG